MVHASAAFAHADAVTIDALRLALIVSTSLVLGLVVREAARGAARAGSLLSLPALVLLSAPGASELLAFGQPAGWRLWALLGGVGLLAVSVLRQVDAHPLDRSQH